MNDDELTTTRRDLENQLYQLTTCYHCAREFIGHFESLVLAEPRAVRASLEAALRLIVKDMTEQQTGVTSLAPGQTDWAKPYRDRGELCPSAFVCTGWVTRSIEQAGVDWRALAGASTPEEQG